MRNWKCVLGAVLACAGITGSAVAQVLLPPTPTPPPAQTQPSAQTQPPPPSNTNTAPSPSTDNTDNVGRAKRTMGYGGTAAGSGLSSAASASGAVAATADAIPLRASMVTFQTTKSTTSSATALIMPGLFTAAAAQSVVPVDRVSVDYGYYNGFRTLSPAGIVPGFNLNQGTFSVEKTIFSGMASVYVSVPLLEASNNITGQTINGLGDVSAGFKTVLLRNSETGSMLTLGLTAAAPTAHSAVYSATSMATAKASGFVADQNGGAFPGISVANSVSMTRTASTSVNPTFLQPWMGGLWVQDRLFVQEYFGVVVPTDERVATFINNNVTLGFELYRSDRNQWVSSLTPLIGMQALLPVNHVANSTPTSSASSSGPPTSKTEIELTQAQINQQLLQSVSGLAAPTLPSSFGFPDQIFLSAGLQVGLGRRAALSVGVVVPVMGPRAYSVGGTMGLTYFY